MTAARAYPVDDEPRVVRRDRGTARTTTRTTTRTTSRTTSSRSTSRTGRPTSASPAAPGRSSRRAVRTPRRGVSGPRPREWWRRASRLQVAAVAVTGAMFVVLMGMITMSAQRVEGQQRLDELQHELTVAQNLNRELRADVAEAESPAVVLASAARLGLVEPGPIVPLAPGPIVPSRPAAAPARGGR